MSRYVHGVVWVFGILLALGALFWVSCYFWGAYYFIKIYHRTPNLRVVPDPEILTLEEASRPDTINFFFDGYSLALPSSSIEEIYPNIHEGRANSVSIYYPHCRILMSKKEKFNAPEILDEIKQEISRTHNVDVDQSLEAARKFARVYRSNYDYFRRLAGASPDQARLFADKYDMILLALMLNMKAIRVNVSGNGWIREFKTPNTKGFWCRNQGDPKRSTDGVEFFKDGHDQYYFAVVWRPADKATERFVREIIASIRFEAPSGKDVRQALATWKKLKRPAGRQASLSQLIVLEKRLPEKLCRRLEKTMRDAGSSHASSFSARVNHHFKQ